MLYRKTILANVTERFMLGNLGQAQLQNVNQKKINEVPFLWHQRSKHRAIADALDLNWRLLRAETWSEGTCLEEMLYGPEMALRRTAEFVDRLSWLSNKHDEKHQKKRTDELSLNRLKLDWATKTHSNRNIDVSGL